ncbi:MAG TPA: hypothetical protein VGN51_04095 [Acidimicrobiia bacterium]|jgi:hypothetical protein
MAGPKQTTRTYAAPADRTFAAAERAVTRVGMKVKETDAARGIVRATTGVTIWSWGERVEVIVTDAGPDSSVLTVSIALKFQLFGWGQQRRVADGLLDEIGRELATNTAG